MIKFKQSDQHRKKICAIIEEHPGYCYCDIQRKSGLTNGILSYHMNVLEKSKHIRIRRENRRTWFFPPSSDPNNDFFLIYSKKETYRKILIFLLKEKQANFSDIKQKIGKSPGTTSIALSNLVQRRLVKRTKDFKKRYEIHDYNKALDLLSKEEPNPIDKAIDRFADTFSYF